MSVEKAAHADDELVAAINRLLPQLSKSACPLSARQVQELLAQQSIHLFVYRDSRDSGELPSNRSLQNSEGLQNSIDLQTDHDPQDCCNSQDTPGSQGHSNFWLSPDSRMLALTNNSGKDGSDSGETSSGSSSSSGEISSGLGESVSGSGESASTSTNSLSCNSANSTPSHPATVTTTGNQADYGQADSKNGESTDSKPSEQIDSTTDKQVSSPADKQIDSTTCRQGDPTTGKQSNSTTSGQADSTTGEPADSNQILGMLTLVTFTIPTGMRAWIEDVVVDSQARGQGVGAQLVSAATEYAFQIGCKTVDLTSRPSREAANRLYQRQGFQKRDTNVYRYTQE